MKILIVDDNISYAKTLRDSLKADHLIDMAHTGEKAVFLAETQSYQLIILDWMLPDISGVDVCKELREDKITTPIIMVTGRGSLDDKVTGLKAGADDYLVKPFELAELKARIEALSRRESSFVMNKNLLQVGDLLFNLSEQKIYCEKQSIKSSKIPNTGIKLKRKEALILEILMKNLNIIVTRKQIIEFAWQASEIPRENIVTVHIANLRRKIQECYKNLNYRVPSGEFILTVHGRGYTIKSQPES